MGIAVGILIENIAFASLESANKKLPVAQICLKSRGIESKI